MRRVFHILAVLPMVLHAQEQSALDGLRAALAGSSERGGKCGTPLLVEAQQRMSDLPDGMQASVQKLLQRPTTQTSRLSPSGRFRIHFDTTGMHQPAALSGSPALRVNSSYNQYVDSVGAIFDECWNREVVASGYDAPPPDGTAGGGPEYDVYIQGFSPGIFGFTAWGIGEVVFESGDRTRTTTHIVIDNDYLGYRTEGWDGLRVTAAHELYHAIQIGGYGIWNTVPNSDFYFYELASVWMEDVVYDGINDYFFDLPIFFSSYKDAMNRSYSFTEFNAAVRAGYERSVFAHYLERRFGATAMREIWEGVRERPILRSIDRVLTGRGSSLDDAFAEFAVWNLFTGSRADTARYYPEGNSYPTVLFNTTAQFGGMTSSIRSSAFPFSLQYYGFRIGSDTVVAVVIQRDAEGAYATPQNAISVEVVLSTSVPPGGVLALKNGLRSGFVVENPDHWRTLFLSSAGRTNLTEPSLAFPNPVSLSRSRFLTLPAGNVQVGPAEVFLISSSLDLIFSGSYQVRDVLGKHEVRIPVRDFGGRVSTGVHFVVLKTAEKESQWKIAIIQ